MNEHGKTYGHPLAYAPLANAAARGDNAPALTTPELVEQLALLVRLGLVWVDARGRYFPVECAQA